MKFDQTLDGLKAREQQGIIAPRVVIEKTLDEMRGFIAPPPKEHALYVVLRDKLRRCAR